MHAGRLQQARKHRMGFPLGCNVESNTNSSRSRSSLYGTPTLVNTCKMVLGHPLTGCKPRRPQADRHAHHCSRTGRTGGCFSHESRGETATTTTRNTRQGACRAGPRRGVGRGNEESGEREERAWVNGLTRQLRDVRRVERRWEAAQGAEGRHG